MGHTFVYPVLLCNIPNQLVKEKGRHSASNFNQRNQGFSALSPLWETDEVEYYSREFDAQPMLFQYPQCHLSNWEPQSYVIKRTEWHT